MCCSKHVEPSINFGIINSITKLQLVGISTETLTKFLSIVLLKYSKHMYHYMILQILTQLQHSEHNVSTATQLHIVSYVDTEREFHFKHLIHKRWFKLSNEYTDSCCQRHLTNLGVETQNEFRHACHPCLVTSTRDRCTCWFASL